jgi:hypothetical protein
MGYMKDMFAETFNRLSAPFPTDDIDWRIGPTNAKSNGGKATRGQPLAFIDARTVMDRLDDIFGPLWECSYEVFGEKTICNLRCGFVNPSTGEVYWISRADGGGDTDMEAEKGSLSTAIKRAAVRFGVGRYLYNLKSPWVALDDHGRIPDAELAKLQELHDVAAQKIGWGPRPEVVTYKVLFHELRHQLTQQQDVLSFRERHKGRLEQLPVAMRQHLDEELARIGSKS